MLLLLLMLLYDPPSVDDENKCFAVVLGRAGLRWAARVDACATCGLVFGLDLARFASHSSCYCCSMNHTWYVFFSLKTASRFAVGLSPRHISATGFLSRVRCFAHDSATEVLSYLLRRVVA